MRTPGLFKFFQLSAICGGLFLLQACSDDKAEEIPCTPDRTVFIPQILRNYFYFDFGSTWTYANANDSDKLDLYQISQSSFSTQNNTAMNPDISQPYCYEDYISAFQRYSSPEKEYDSKTRIENSRFNTPLSGTFDVIYSDMNGNTQYIVTYNPDSTFAKAGPTGTITVLVADTVLFGRNYKDVIRCSYTNSSNHLYPYSEVLYARNIGKIQFTLQNGPTWFLKNYTVKQ
ncbi:MAG TPA: hypothetical protein DIW47_01210 [Bacteroidetes bacterium]|nr:hypothetical protein [Bacteroidota bacterium]